MLKPQDIFILLKLVVIGSRSWSYTILAVELGMSSSQIHSAIKRALAAKLAVRQREKIVPDFRNLEEFLIHGLKYVFWAEQGEMTRGMPTAYAGPLRLRSYWSAPLRSLPQSGLIRRARYGELPFYHYISRHPRQRAPIRIFTSC
jgi:hypothetical protein